VGGVVSYTAVLAGRGSERAPADLVGPREALLAGSRATAVTVRQADAADLRAYRRLRHDVFVEEQGLFGRAGDHDDVDDDPRTVVLVAVAARGDVVGGVRLAPATAADLGWWTGSRLLVRRQARSAAGIGSVLVRAACARAEAEGALRFEAAVQPQNQVLFTRLGWVAAGPVVVAGRPHLRMRWPVGRVTALVEATKAPLGTLLAGLHLGGPGFAGDDAAPVPGSDLVAACDAIVPSMVERDPEWAGWCSVVVNVNDLAAMGADPVGLLDAVAGPSAAAVGRVLSGLRAAAEAYGVPVLGGHTQLGVPPALAVTALGRTTQPVPAGGGRPGQAVRLTADLAGGWRPGYGGRQWDSTSTRRGEDLRHMVGALGRRPPAAAKDVSMAGVVGTLGMLAEASGCGAELDVAAVPRPAAARVADWFTCFPGFALLTADAPGDPGPEAGPAVSAECGRLTGGHGVTLRWPDGEVTSAVTGAVTGIGAVDPEMASGRDQGRTRVVP
jgi:putative N-acetyltransferase (TIGR04045 family)